MTEREETFSEIADRLRAHWERSAHFQAEPLMRLINCIDSCEDVNLSGIDRDLIVYALARTLSLQEHGWQPIETAPKDEVLHMGWWKTWPPSWPDHPRWNQEIGTYCCTRGGWRHSLATHWKPVAAPPAAPAMVAEERTK